MKKFYIFVGILYIVQLLSSNPAFSAKPPGLQGKTPPGLENKTPAGWSKGKKIGWDKNINLKNKKHKHIQHNNILQ